MGSWEVIKGEIQATLSITGKFTYSITNTGAYLNGNNSGPFYLPYSLVDVKSDHNDSEENSSLKRLAEIDDGHVAEVSLSLKNLASPDQLMKLLSDYDVAVTAMPIIIFHILPLNLFMNLMRTDLTTSFPKKLDRCRNKLTP